MRKLAGLLAGIALYGLSAPMAYATLLEATWSGSINDIMAPDLWLFDSLTDLDSSDIVMGASVGGKVIIDTGLSGPDLDGSADRYVANPTNQLPIGPPPYFLTVSLSLNGNSFTPVSEPRPLGPILDGDADSYFAWASDGSFKIGSDWDTVFGFGLIEHDRAIDLEGLGVSGFVDDLPTTATDFSGFSGQGFAGVKRKSLISGVEERTFFGFSITSMSNFSQIPEPATLALLGLGFAGLGFARRMKAS